MTGKAARFALHRLWRMPLERTLGNLVIMLTTVRGVGETPRRVLWFLDGLVLPEMFRCSVFTSRRVHDIRWCLYA